MIRRFCFLSLFLLFLAGGFASGQGSERILSFHSDITIHEDTSLSVIETIEVRANGNQIQRGIFRDFPRLYESKWGLKRKRGFDVESVLKNGTPEPYKIENISGGTRVRIGRASVRLKPGIYTYTIKYKTTRQLGYFKEHDELYWNVTGNGWAFPIDKASATVRLPGGARPMEIGAYTGRAGSKGQEYRSETKPDDSIFIETTAPLAMKEGLTIVTTWPKGAVDYAADPQGASATIRDNPAAATAVFGLFGLLTYFYLAWSRVGRDPRPGTIIPLYGPPEGFSPAAVRNLYRMAFDDQAFSAAVIGLASKGVLTIEEEGKTYTLTKTGQTADFTNDESILFRHLMSGSKPLELKQTNHSKIGGARTALKKALANKLEKTHFVKNLSYWFWGLLITIIPLGLAVFLQNPEGLFMLLWLTIWSLGTMVLVSGVISSWRGGRPPIAMTLFSLPFVAGWIGGVIAFTVMVSLFIGLIFGLSMLTLIIFYHLLKAPTHFGRQVLDQIEGFRQYLSVAEADRLNLVNPPERTPELFERFLPYALALDVDQQWSEQFSDVLAAAAQASGEGGGRTYAPSFYTGNSSMNQMAAGALTSAIAGSLTAALASSSVSPSSSSGGGGGGSSGGGGGGGGGGGW